MKHLLLTTIAAALLVGCGESQQSAPSPESKPAAEAATPEPPPKPPTAKAPDISIHDAAKAGNIEAVKQHLAAGADVNTKGGWLEVTPLYYAAGEGHKEIAELLIAKGADVNAKAEDGVAPLHVAAGEGHKEIAELLVGTGANVNVIDVNGKTPLDIASLPDNPNDTAEAIDLLRKHGGKTGEELL